MDHYVKILLLLALVLAGPPVLMMDAPAMANLTVTEWTNGDNDRAWMNGNNWSNGVPDESNIALIPNTLPNDQNEYPILDTAAAQEIGQLVIQAQYAGVDELIIAGHSTNARVLKVLTRDGIYLAGASSNDATIRLGEKAELWVSGGGVLGPDGEIIFDASAGDPQDNPPRFVLGDGSTLTIRSDLQSGSGSPEFIAVTKTLITGEVAAQDDLAETLVLGFSGRMYGNYDIDTILVNNGHVYTSFDDDPGDINLLCHPKSGSGYWDVDGGDDQTQSTLTIEAGLVTSAAVYVHPYGRMRVRRPTTISQRPGFPTDHRLRLEEPSHLIVRQDRVFDANRWPTLCVTVPQE